MVQIIQERQSKPSLGQRLSAGVGKGLEVGQQLMQQNQQEKALSKFPELQGLPPELQKVAFAEMMKQKGKEDILSQKQKMFGEVFGKKQDKESSFSDQMNGQSENQQNQPEDLQN